MVLGPNATFPQLEIDKKMYVPVVEAFPQQLPFVRHLDTAGNGTGTKNANGNYSGSVGTEIFYIQPASGVVFQIRRLIAVVVDGTGGNDTEYGNLGAALTAGVTVRVQDGSGTILDLTDGDPVAANRDWYRIADVTIAAFALSNDVLQAVWDFSPRLRLEGGSSERLEVVLNDDLTGLTEHYFIVHGFTERNFT